MKLVIEIDENVFTRLFDNGTEDYAIVNDDLFAIAKSIRNCTPLPQNSTNGDVIKAMFPNADISLNDSCFEGVVNRYGFNQTWWNAPYKAGEAE